MCFNRLFLTATSFVTNTNWQNYGGEITHSYLLQMVMRILVRLNSSAPAPDSTVCWFLL
jgi:K+-transporting ATPase A subunit